MKYKLYLYNPKGTLMVVETHKTEYSAWASGENWKMLSRGNSYVVTKVINKKSELIKRWRKNPPVEEIYNQILSIQAVKGRKSLWPGQHFRHDFSSKDSEILGLPDGSVLIKSRSGKRLWRKFQYD